MECPHCKKEIEGFEEEKVGPFTKDKQLFLKNFILISIPFAILFGLLNHYTSIPLSVDDGLKWNLYLSPLLFIAVFYFIYTELYCAGKVKGRFLIK